MAVTFLDATLAISYFILLFLAIFWMLILFSGEKEQKKKKLRSFPYFSTIVPAFNEGQGIKATLQSLCNLDYPKEKREFIVVNDGSTDKTREVVEKFIAENPDENIVLINQENKGKGNAMNKGLARAKGEFVACLDGDSFIQPNALQEMLPLFEDTQVAAVCPLMKVKKPENMLQKIQWCEYTINMFYRYLNARVHAIHVTPGPFSIYRTQVIRDLGGFDETTITEDLEIAIRLQKHHYKILQTFDAIVETVPPKTWKALFRQRVRWYKGSVDNSIRYKKLMFNKEYGDFGFIRMPTIILSGIIAVVLAFAVGQALVRKIGYGFASLQNINFDLLTLIKNISFDFNWLTLPMFRIVIAATLIGISVYVMYKSFKLVKEKITNYGRTWISVTTYLLIYSLFLTTVWIYIGYMFVRKKSNFWK